MTEWRVSLLYVVSCILLSGVILEHNANALADCLLTKHSKLTHHSSVWIQKVDVKIRHQCFPRRVRQFALIVLKRVRIRADGPTVTTPNSQTVQQPPQPHNNWLTAPNLGTVLCLLQHVHRVPSSPRRVPVSVYSVLLTAAPQLRPPPYVCAAMATTAGTLISRMNPAPVSIHTLTLLYRYIRLCAVSLLHLF